MAKRAKRDAAREAAQHAEPAAGSQRGTPEPEQQAVAGSDSRDMSRMPFGGFRHFVATCCPLGASAEEQEQHVAEIFAAALRARSDASWGDDGTGGFDACESLSEREWLAAVVRVARLRHVQPTMAGRLEALCVDDVRATLEAADSPEAFVNPDSFRHRRLYREDVLAATAPLVPPLQAVLCKRRGLEAFRAAGEDGASAERVLGVEAWLKLLEDAELLHVRADPEHPYMGREGEAAARRGISCTLMIWAPSLWHPQHSGTACPPHHSPTLQPRQHLWP